MASSHVRVPSFNMSSNSNVICTISRHILMLMESSDCFHGRVDSDTPQASLSAFAQVCLSQAKLQRRQLPACNCAHRDSKPARSHAGSNYAH